MAITKVSDFSISDFPADTTFLLDTNVLLIYLKTANWSSRQLFGNSEQFKRLLELQHSEF